MATRKARPPEPDDDDRPDDATRKKKKKKSKEEPSRGLLYAGAAGIGVVALILLAIPIWFIASYAGGGAVKPISQWDQYSTAENEFGFDYPVGWKTKSYGIKGKREVDVKGDGASISVKENLQGSLVGDIAGAFDRGGPVNDDQLPVARVHALRVPQESSTYKEGPATTVTSRFGKVRKSPYTDGSRRGYRATVLMHQTALDVFCECRASDWNTLQPAFDRVIESLGPGTF